MLVHKGKQKQAEGADYRSQDLAAECKEGMLQGTQQCTRTHEHTARASADYHEKGVDEEVEGEGRAGCAWIRAVPEG